MQALIDVPAGLNNVAVTTTQIGDVRGDEGFFHYRQHDATELARTRTFEEVWHLFERGHLPTEGEAADFSTLLSTARRVPEPLDGLIDAVAGTPGAPLAGLRTVLSAASALIGAHPMLDVEHAQRVEQARRLAAIVPGVLARLHRRTIGLDLVASDPELPH